MDDVETITRDDLISLLAAGLEQAHALRDFIAGGAGSQGVREYAVYNDLALIDDIIPDFERVETWLSGAPDRLPSPERMKALQASFERVAEWHAAMEAGRVEPGGFQGLSPDHIL